MAQIFLNKIEQLKLIFKVEFQEACVVISNRLRHWAHNSHASEERLLHSKLLLNLCICEGLGHLK